jgi:hypothetical protein
MPDAGIDLRDADVFVGMSAGSIVAVQITNWPLIGGTLPVSFLRENRRNCLINSDDVHIIRAGSPRSIAEEGRPVVMKTVSEVLLLSAVALSAATVRVMPSQVQADPAYPDGFREWALVKSAVIVATHPAFATEGGIHHIYANAVARSGYGSGSFQDGAVIVYELLEAPETGGVMSEGRRRRVDVMVRDRARYAATGGWGFKRFAGNEQHDLVGEKATAMCFSCHQRQVPNFVFSRYRH